MKVLLLSPPYLPGYMRNARCDFVSLSATQWFPIWLGYCGSLLEKSGHNIKLIDAPSYGLSHKKTKELFLDYKPDLLVVYTGQKSEKNDVDFIDDLLLEYSCPAVFVGPYFSIAPENTLAKSKRVKYGVYGEFEYPVLEFLQGRDVKEIKNFLIKENDSIKINNKRPNLSTVELDNIPFVSEFFYKHLDFKYYKAPSEYHPFIDLMTGRGCVWGLCTYCLWVHSFIKGGTYSIRSIDTVMDEFKFIEKYMPHVRSVMIQDDTFPDERAREFSMAKLKAGVKIPWSCYARGNLNFETLKVMKKANCRNLHVGFESADNQILKKIKKGVTKKRMTKFAEDAHRAGLRIHGDFAIGFPGESRESIEKTVQWACEIRPHTAQFQLMIPFPGTPFYEELKRNNCLLNNAPHFPGLSRKEMENMAKKAYRRFYISFRFIWQVMKHPYDLFFSRIKTYKHAIASVFWKKWDTRE